ncbi:MAG: 23S rRNA (guanosine(2251)-2'-O)-methyltransferase RlmB [Oscillospiraceae bacterium]|nr:23S rRNA (guanosine(2251)-2'-O)-methyltransferase RlmB [Oscillospiraceae bacterium]
MQGKGRGSDGGRNRKPPARHFDPYGKRPDFDELGDGRGEGLIEGRNAVLEALRAGVVIDKVFIAKGETDSALGHIAAMARQSGAAVVDADRRKLDSMSVTHAHQGVIAMSACADYATIDEIIENAKEKGEELLVVLCDEISDPHNLGAIIRTCEASGAHGIVIPKRRSAGLSATVAKASSGAVYHIPIARVTNMTATINELKKAGVWVFGASANGTTNLWQADFMGPVALVIGSEGAGIGRLVGESCDFNVSIPMRGKIGSLNASVSAAVLMYEVVRQRS